MAQPDHLVLAAGGIALAGGFAKEGHFPSNGGAAIIGTVGLTLIASALKSSRIAPIVTAFAWLFLIAAVYSVVPGLHKATQNLVKQPKPKGKPHG